MKLKFTNEVWKTIEAIAFFDPDSLNPEHYKNPEKLVVQQLKECEAMSDRTAKYRARVRRETSMLLGYIATAVKLNKTPQQTYVSLIQACRGIVSLQALKSPEFINLAASYGVIRFSEVELEQLINVNRIPEFAVEVSGCKLEKKTEGERKSEGESVISGVSDFEAEFYGVYLGDSSAGRVKHHVDCNTREEAMGLARTYLKQGFVTRISDKTWATVNR